MTLSNLRSNIPGNRGLVIPKGDTVIPGGIPECAKGITWCPGKELEFAPAGGPSSVFGRDSPLSGLETS